MRIRKFGKNVYRLADYSLGQSRLEVYRLEFEEPVRRWETLKSEGVSDDIIAEIVGISRAKYYRLKRKLADLDKGILPKTKRPHKLRVSAIAQETKDIILKIRRENQTYGKAKIAVILRRDYGIKLSESSVGRVLKNMLERGIITKSRAACRKKRKRKWNKHAKPWNYKMKALKPGEMVQIDHMTVTVNNVTVKHFQAWDPITKTMVTQVYSNANARSARKFLLKLIEKLPFPLLSIQVDGGSEFMKEFEQECENRNLPLLVLPPKRPQYNGGVERGNRTFRNEFYDNPNLLADSVGEINYQLQHHTNKYNNFRPHFSLDGKTPSEYTNNITYKTA